MAALTITTRGLAVGYGRQIVARIPDVTIGPGAVWLVTGPNGSGKSTLLKSLAALLPPVDGSMSPIPARGSGGAVFVHSTPVLFRGTLRDNLRIATEGDAAIAKVAEEFDLHDRLDQPAYELSHGMRQRAALARAILARPGLLLLDEPEGALDQKALTLWRAFAQRAAEGRELTLVIAAHRPAGLEGVPVQTLALG